MHCAVIMAVNSARRKKSVLKLLALEDAVHDVAANRGARAENGSVTHLLAKLLAVLLEFARLPRFHGHTGARLAHSHW